MLALNGSAVQLRCLLLPARLRGSLLGLATVLLIVATMMPSHTSALPMQHQSDEPSFLKRAGFVGMRGKKGMPSLDEAGAESESWLFDEDSGLGDRNMYKRAGFVGMRGKKMHPDQQAWLNQLLNKRAGFVGMRGKKNDDTSAESVWKRAGFVGMRGKKSGPYLMDDAAAAYEPLDWASQLSGLKSRRGSSGFVGMRG